MTNVIMSERVSNVVTCPKCHYVRQPTDRAPEYECPSCGIVYAKFDAKADLEMRLDRARKTGNWAGVPHEHIPEQIRIDWQAREATRIQAEAEKARALEAAQQQAAMEQHQRIARKTLLLTTTPTVPGSEIAEVIDIVSAECVYGMHMLKDLFAAVTDVVGGRSGKTQEVLRDARRTAMSELRAEAFDLGADAVVGVDLKVNEISGGGKSMLFVVATGTAVKLSTGQALTRQPTSN